MKLISAFVFATWIVQFRFYLNPKFQASSHLLSLYSPICVGPGRKPRRSVFSHEAQFVSAMQVLLRTHKIPEAIPPLSHTQNLGPFNQVHVCVASLGNEVPMSLTMKPTIVFSKPKFQTKMLLQNVTDRTANFEAEEHSDWE